MKRFFAILVIAVGMLPLSALADGPGHTAAGSPSGSKRITADPGGRDFSSRAYSIAGQCDTTRPGGETGPLPAGPEGPGGSPGASLFTQKCSKCHSAKPTAANFSQFIGGTKTPPGPMVSVLAGLSAAEKQAILAYLQGN